MMAIDIAALDTLDLTRQLESAIQNDQFELRYQPLIDVRDGSMYGVEALIRWNHPERGLLKPTEFVSLAEETGLIVAIGSWVLRQACTEFRQMQSRNRDLLLSVNVSSVQLDDPAFISLLADIIRQTGIDPHSLQLEITESIFLSDSLRIGALFHAIRTLGVTIAFDDFGTGYSSLSYLAKYPVDVVKIDQYFVQRMGLGHVNMEIVHLIVHLAHTIGMKVTAEGVETQEQADLLSRLGCNIAQGFLYSRPVSLQTIIAMLACEANASDPIKCRTARPSSGVPAGRSFPSYLASVPARGARKYHSISLF